MTCVCLLCLIRMIKPKSAQASLWRSDWRGAILPMSTANGIQKLCLLQGSHDWTGLYSKTSDVDNPVPDDTFREELLKTGYLTQAAYAYLGVYVAHKRNMYLPMVSTLLRCARNVRHEY